MQLWALLRQREGQTERLEHCHGVVVLEGMNERDNIPLNVFLSELRYTYPNLKIVVAIEDRIRPGDPKQQEIFTVSKRFTDLLSTGGAGYEWNGDKVRAEDEHPLVRERGFTWCPLLAPHTMLQDLKRGLGTAKALRARCEVVFNLSLYNLFAKVHRDPRVRGDGASVGPQCDTSFMKDYGFTPYKLREWMEQCAPMITGANTAGLKCNPVIVPYAFVYSCAGIIGNWPFGWAPWEGVFDPIEKEWPIDSD